MPFLNHTQFNITQRTKLFNIDTSRHFLPNHTTGANIFKLCRKPSSQIRASLLHVLLPPLRIRNQTSTHHYRHRIVPPKKGSYNNNNKNYKIPLRISIQLMNTRVTATTASAVTRLISTTTKKRQQLSCLIYRQIDRCYK